MKFTRPVAASIMIAGLLIFPSAVLSLTSLRQEGESVPGSTTGILLMGILMVLIIIIPIVWTRRKWM